MLTPNEPSPDSFFDRLQLVLLGKAAFGDDVGEGAKWGGDADSSDRCDVSRVEATPVQAQRVRRGRHSQATKVQYEPRLTTEGFIDGAMTMMDAILGRVSSRVRTLSGNGPDEAGRGPRVRTTDGRWRRREPARTPRAAKVLARI